MASQSARDADAAALSAQLESERKKNEVLVAQNAVLEAKSRAEAQARRDQEAKLKEAEKETKEQEARAAHLREVAIAKDKQIGKLALKLSIAQDSKEAKKEEKKAAPKRKRQDDEDEEKKEGGEKKLKPAEAKPVKIRTPEQLQADELRRKEKQAVDAKHKRALHDRLVICIAAMVQHVSKVVESSSLPLSWPRLLEICKEFNKGCVPSKEDPNLRPVPKSKFAFHLKDAVDHGLFVYCDSYQKVKEWYEHTVWSRAKLLAMKDFPGTDPLRTKVISTLVDKFKQGAVSHPGGFSNIRAVNRWIRKVEDDFALANKSKVVRLTRGSVINCLAVTYPNDFRCSTPRREFLTTAGGNSPRRRSTSR